MSDSKSGAGGRKTVVDEGTQFKGSLTSDCPIEVKGRVEGDLAAPSLVVSPSGGIRGRVKVGELKSDGEIAGEFDADVVQLSGTVKDNTVIRAKSLEVKLAPPNGKMQVIFGECELNVGDEQARKDAGEAKEQPKRSRPTSVPPQANANGAS
jgi:cytoskeletal protein CcmA (bactofilin family)